jgi:hypothetical protein
MGVLSIDVGIKNLAMCLIDENTKVILQWDVSGVPTEHEDGLFKSIVWHLDQKPWVLTANTILIERQPDKNRKMKMVEHLLQAYFVIKCPKSETILYDAKHKIPDVVGPGKAQYRKRKQTSIDRCREFIQSPENSHWVTEFVHSQKKDDLADTVMQALSFINRAPAKETTKEKSSKLSARKPTEHQKTTKYSKSNLAWFAKNLSRDQFERDKRIMKDLGKYYRSVDEFFSCL